jgi:hypothetical protein
LLISGDGAYTIIKVEEGDFDPLVEWAQSAIINQGNADNHIHAVCDGNYLALTVNGKLLAEVYDSTFSSGDIALTATSYEDTPTEIHFDDLSVSAP